MTPNRRKSLVQRLSPREMDPFLFHLTGGLKTHFPLFLFFLFLAGKYRINYLFIFLDRQGN